MFSALDHSLKFGGSALSFFWRDGFLQRSFDVFNRVLTFSGPKFSFFGRGGFNYLGEVFGFFISQSGFFFVGRNSSTFCLDGWVLF